MAPRLRSHFTSSSFLREVGLLELTRACGKLNARADDRRSIIDLLSSGKLNKSLSLTDMGILISASAFVVALLLVIIRLLSVHSRIHSSLRDRTLQIAIASIAMLRCSDDVRISIETCEMP
ncbi:hypothetical protein SISNIDRAFT_260446 [Sistotremastrum niveocremeum HHB9708]|uniref:Uncharacterized protein n=2 Tax=Sistotremastraceae TaxID=3402574 RepID=A0A164P9R6_9AGAM|nr:hypothetical protein SISNIDRAFT_260446 [Sistotremastrum niveocremeum HHB9708]KZT32730.1 hypothetical protein SISSUDRAFT_489521 [Sistotremastrum suecicum HHB10207 ss-3]